MSQNWRKDWEIAMAWWQKQPEFLRTVIRQVASTRLSYRLKGTGQGISSSDTNHEVFSMWREYTRAGSPDIYIWLRDMCNTYT